MIGSSLVRVSLAKGHDVVALCRANSPRVSNLPRDGRLAIIDCDVSALDSLDIKPIGKADYLFHLAWTGTAAKTRNDAFAQERNIRYSLDAVSLAGRLGCTSFVGAGSQAEYGRTHCDLTPSTPTNPENGYGAAKLAAGQLTRIACAQLGIRHEWARILSVYGPRDVAHSLVMSVIGDACAGRPPACTAGEQLWDYLYCDDCAEALLAMAERGVDGAVYPIGSGSPRRLADYIRSICACCATGVHPRLGALPYPPGQVMQLCADITTLTRDTGFQPHVTFEEGVARTIAWYRRQHG